MVTLVLSWCYPNWTTETQTTPPTHLSAFTDWTSQSGSTTRSLCWHIKLYIKVRSGTWDHSFLLPIYPADRHYAMVAPVMPSVRHSTVTVPGACVWNTLPEEIATSRHSRPFVNDLKHLWLFRKSFPDIIVWTSFLGRPVTVVLEGIMFYNRCLFIYVFIYFTTGSPSSSADRRETLPYDRYMGVLYNASPKIRGHWSSPLKHFTLGKIWDNFTQLPSGLF